VEEEGVTGTFSMGSRGRRPRKCADDMSHIGIICIEQRQNFNQKSIITTTHTYNQDIIVYIRYAADLVQTFSSIFGCWRIAS